jgi:organic hydroperoxide reductase OsmC/OhrA
MKISAQVWNHENSHQVQVATDGKAQSIVIPPKPSGFGSSLNGGELLFLALASCYCNDIYREARRMDIRVTSVEVEVQGDFGEPGEPAKNVTYRAKVTAQASQPEIQQLMLQTDRMAEIQNTLRVGTPVELTKVEIVPVKIA